MPGDFKEGLKNRMGHYILPRKNNLQIQFFRNLKKCVLCVYGEYAKREKVFTYFG